MIEMYIIYNKNTKEIVEAAKIDRERDQQWIANGDTSTVLGHINNKLRDNNLAVLYLPPLNIPDIKMYKITDTCDNIRIKTLEELDYDNKQELIKQKQAELEEINRLMTLPEIKEQLELELADLVK